MKTEPGSSTPEAIFAAFLQEFHEGRGSLEDLCNEHREHAERFRAMFSMLAELDEVTATDAAPKTVRPTRPLEGLELVREIGRGGMGVVWEARDTKLDRRVAVKLLPERSNLWNEARARFQREVTALGRLAHPHIVTVHRAELEDTRPHLVMEYVPGASLQEILRALEEPGRRTRPTPSSFRRAVRALHDAARQSTEETTQAAETNESTWFELVARLVAETAEALDYAHHHGIVHRDVKPGNILVDLWGRARLVDFGISKVKDEATLTVTGGFTGTAAYAAPEQISSDIGAPDGRTDVYALGVVLYRLLTGQLPFDSPETRVLFHRVLNEPPSSPRKLAPDVPLDLAIICEKAIEKKPSSRYSTALAFAADLRAWLAHRPIAARPPSYVRRLVRKAQRHPWITGFLATSLLVSAAFPVASFLTEMREHRARVQAAERSLTAIEEDLDGLRGQHERIASHLARRNQLRSERWEGPLAPTQRGSYLELLAERRERRDDLTPVYWDLAQRLSKVEGVLGRERIAPLQFAMWTDVAQFAERTADRRLWLAAMARLGREESSLEEQRHEVILSGVPKDAELYLFAYLDEYRVRAEPRFPRRLPTPVDESGAAIAFPLHATWKPGESCRVAFEGFVSEDGRVVREGTILVANEEGERYQAFERDAWVPLHASDRTVERHTRPTQYPLFRLAANRVRGPRLELPAGSYLLLVTSLEHDSQRFPFVVTERGATTVNVELVPRGTTPTGFVRVPAGWFRSGGDRGRSFQALRPAARCIEGFWIGVEEVTFREYLEALSWKEKQDPGSTREHLPQDRRGEGRETFDVDPETFTIWPPGYAESPVCSIRYEDALFYCRILSERSVRQGEPWVYELPWQLSWEKAARGADGRIFPWGGEEDDLVDSWAGDAFDWQLIDGARSRTPAPWIPAPTEQALGDESPYGVLGMTGGVEEFVYLDPGQPTSRPARMGGGIGNPDPTAHRMPRVVPHATLPSRGYGFRVVARRRDDPLQDELPK